MEQLPLYQQIYKAIREEIVTGVYAPGKLLPSEKELANIHHVSRITSKKAMNLLAQGGFVIRMRGKGSFVADQLPRLQDADVKTRRPSRLIGVILDGFSASFGCRMVNGILNGCEAGGCSPILRCSSGSLKKETLAIEELSAFGVCGFLIMCVHDENYNERILQLVIEHVPVVTLDRRLKGIPVPFIGTDNVSASRELTAGLLKKGYRKIGFVKPCSQETSTLMDRQLGFQQAFHEHGLLADESLWLTDLSSTLPRTTNQDALSRDIRRINQYLAHHPHTEAFLASEYGLAKLLDHCLTKAGKRKDAAIVCFDGPRSSFSNTEFIHVSQGEEEIGRLGTELLLQIVEGLETPKTVLVPYEINL